MGSGRSRAARERLKRAREAAVRRPPIDPRSRWEQVEIAVLSNAVVAYLLITGRIDPLGLVLLVASEAILLSIVEAVESRFVPPEAREEQLRSSLVGRIAILLFILAVLLGFNLLLIVSVLKRGDAVRAFLEAPLATLHAEQIVAPLAVTFLGALLGAARDLVRYRERGGPFEATPGRNAIARWLVLILAVLPHAVPLIGMLWLGFRLLVWRSDRAARGLGKSVAAWQVIGWFGLWIATFFLVVRLYASGLAGWSVFFCVAKTVADLALAFAPGSAAEGEDVDSTPGPAPRDGAESSAVR